MYRFLHTLYFGYQENRPAMEHLFSGKILEYKVHCTFSSFIEELDGGYIMFVSDNDASATVALRTKFAKLAADRHSTPYTEKRETHTASNDGSQLTWKICSGGPP